MTHTFASLRLCEHKIKANHCEPCGKNLYLPHGNCIHQNPTRYRQNHRRRTRYCFHFHFRRRHNHQKNPERFTYIESTISNKLGELGKEIPQDTTGSKFYERVILNVQDLVSTKKITLKDNDSQSTITQLTNEKKELEKELKDLYLKIQLQAAG